MNFSAPNTLKSSSNFWENPRFETSVWKPLSRPKAGFQRTGRLWFWSCQSRNVTLKIRARESKTREIWQSDGAQIFFGSCYDVSHEKKTCDTKIPSFGGGQIMVQVAYSSIKKSKIRFEFRRLLDRLEVYERCQITQRERETISLRPAAPPRVNLVRLLKDYSSNSIFDQIVLKSRLQPENDYIFSRNYPEDCYPK